MNRSQTDLWATHAQFRWRERLWIPALRMYGIFHQASLLKWCCFGLLFRMFPTRSSASKPTILIRGFLLCDCLKQSETQYSTWAKGIFRKLLYSIFWWESTGRSQFLLYYTMMEMTYFFNFFDFFFALIFSLPLFFHTVLKLILFSYLVYIFLFPFSLFHFPCLFSYFSFPNVHFPDLQSSVFRICKV